MIKQQYFLLLLILTSGCNKSESKYYSPIPVELKDLASLNNYINTYSYNDTVNVDTFNLFHRSLKLYKPNDSILIFTSGFKQSCILIITEDSIHRFEFSEMICISNLGPWTREIYSNENLSISKKLDSICAIIENNSQIFYKYRFEKHILQLISLNYMLREILCMNYANKEIDISIGEYYMSYKNEYVDLKKYKFIQQWPYDLDTFTVYKPVNPLIHPKAENYREYCK